MLAAVLGWGFPVKVPLLYFINGQKGGLDCTPLYIKELINKNFNFASLFKAHAGWWAYTSKV